MKYSVVLENFDQLTDLEKSCASNNGAGKEWATYVRITYDGETQFLESDAIEPEDKTFSRDLGWVVDALEQAYNLGYNDGQSQTRHRHTSVLL